MNAAPASTQYTSVELFSGCGGLAMGLSRAGFKHELLVEWDDHAVNTLAENKARGSNYVRDWEVVHGDVREIDWSEFQGVDVVAGGPPCQPFSVGGKAEGNRDRRDMWPEAIRAIREIQPQAFVFENVRGLLRPAFEDYVRWITLYLATPDLLPKKSESYSSHLKRLESTSQKAKYDVQVFPVNAADYGAPQKRQRVLFVGIRKDLNASSLPFPERTHSEERLVWDKWVTGSYWKRHGIKQPPNDRIPNREARILRRLEKTDNEPDTLPWVTCRDAFHGLGEPGANADLLNHLYQEGARSYPGHTGSPIDEPAKALKAGVHGVPGGENMLQREDGSVRYFSIRESARLQGLPDDFFFPGSWTEAMRQLGNAVPVALSEFAARWLADRVLARKRRRSAA